MQTTMRITETGQTIDLGDRAKEYHQDGRSAGEQYVFTGGVSYRVDHVSRSVQNHQASQELHVTKM